MINQVKTEALLLEINAPNSLDLRDIEIKKKNLYNFGVHFT